MYIRSKETPLTPITLELAQEVIIPLCRDAVKTRGGNPSKCSVKLPESPDPRIDIRSLERAKANENLAEKRASVLEIQSCEKTDLQSGGKNLYRLFFSAAPDLYLPQGIPLSRYVKVNGGWQLKKLGFNDQILRGGVAKTQLCAQLQPGHICHYVNYFGNPGPLGLGFDGVCKSLQKTKLGSVGAWGISRFNEEVIPL